MRRFKNSLLERRIARLERSLKCEADNFYIPRAEFTDSERDEVYEFHREYNRLRDEFGRMFRRYSDILVKCSGGDLPAAMGRPIEQSPYRAVSSVYDDIVDTGENKLKKAWKYSSEYDDMF